MALQHYSLPNLIGGISQQPLAMRFRGQAEAQENALSSVADGLVKRYPTEHVARIVTPAPADSFIHTIDRDALERYIVTIAGGSLEVFDLDGTSVPVFAGQAGGAADFTYLSSTASDHKATTVADFTFILNTAQTVAEIPVFPATPSEDAFIFVRQGAALTDYSVTVKRGAATDTFEASTWNGTSLASFCEGAQGNTQPVCEANGGVWASSQINSIKTDDIADKLRQEFDADPNITATRQGSVVRLVPTPGFEFDAIEVSDSLGDTALIKVFKEVPLLEDLPLIGLDGYRVKITGEPTEGDSPVDDYYLIFDADESGAFGQGRWVETYDGVSNVEIDAATMPHKLVRYQDDALGTVTGTADAFYFGFEEITWDDRAVGDPLTNPSPTFIGNTIQDLFFFRGRLGFLADQNVILSEANSFFNFWRTTVLTLLDSDPIDIASNTTRVSLLQHAVPLAERLIVFSDRTQFVLNDQPTLTPATAALQPVLQFENTADAAPVTTGPGLLFAASKGAFSSLREMIALDREELFDADEVTAHVARYISGDVLEMAASPLENTVLIRASGEPQTLYVYSYFWAGRERVQSAWHKWTFDAEVVGVSWIRSTAYLVMKRTDGLYLESMTVSSGLSDTDSEYVVRLDRRVDSADLAAPTYDSTEDLTTFTLPFDVPSGVRAVTQATGSAEAGVPVTVDSVSGTTVDLRGDQTSVALWFGIPFTMSYQFSAPTIKAPANNGEAIVSNVEFLMRSMTLEYDDTGFFSVSYTPDTRDPYTEDFPITRLDTRSRLGQVRLASGKVRTYILGLANPRTNITVSSDSHLPVRLLSAEIEGEVDGRSQRT